MSSAPAFGLRNLREQTVQPCTPWEFVPETPVSDSLRENKKARTAWILNEFTDHQVYSLVEGVNPNLRIAKPKADSEGNPPRVVHGLAADYDGRQWSLELVRDAASQASIPPSWYERTLSGYVRLVWLFEEPVAVPTWDLAVAFLTHALGQLKASNLLPGLDKGSFDPGRYYTNSGEWTDLGNAKIPADVTRGWFFEVAKLHKDPRPDLEIPLQDVADALRAKYPRFCEWDGTFEAGSQGPSFWIDGSVSPKSALVKPGGLYTFSGHAMRPFYSWEDLLGAKFIETYKSQRNGGLVEGVFYDSATGKYMFPSAVPNCWIPLDSTSTIRQLKVRGAKGSSKNGGLSEAEELIAHVQLHQTVTGAGPFLYRKPGPVFYMGQKYLNTCLAKVVQPSGLKGEDWGPEGRFPFICRVLEGLFPDDALGHFLGWLQRAYKSGLDYLPCPGHAIVLAGPPASGKSFIALRLIGDLMGGGTDARNLAFGEDSFTTPYLERGVWLLDDVIPAQTDAEHRQYTHRLKGFVSNETYVSNAKFRGQMTVPWLGRLVICINDDDNSREALPNPTASNGDKLCFYHLRAAEEGLFSRDRQLNNATIEKELPHFAQWLLGYSVPVHWLATDDASVRLGLKAYHDPELYQAGQQNDEAVHVRELLSRWQRIYFKENPEKESWTGTTSDLIREFVQYEPQGSTLASRLTPRRVGNLLRTLHTEGAIVANEKGLIRTWTITKPENTTEAPALKPTSPEPKEVEEFKSHP